ncbi:MAG TPA: hypothetical protein VFV58_36050, partial [Blastocatellia bacterium]|nr:hypothetical protein [Blastocatellia bacterium]
ARVIVFIMDSFPLTKTQELFSANGKFLDNEAAKRANSNADERHTQEKARQETRAFQIKRLAET